MADINTIKQKWTDILDYIKNEFEVSDVSYDTWLSPLVPKSVDSDSVTIAAPDDITLNYIINKFDKRFKVAISEVTGFLLTPVFVLASEYEERSLSEVKPLQDDSLRRANLVRKYTFDAFVSGKSNELAHAASLAVAENPGKDYKILYIYGGVGLGKTHLMNAIGIYILKNNPNANVLYIQSETFTNEYIESIRNNTTQAFRNKYRQLDVLLIDDIQFIANKDSTQEEFFYTFNTLFADNKQIVISSDKPPKEINNLAERIRSRFEGGLIVDIQPPNFETRMAILRKKEEIEGYNIDDEIIKYIATNIKSNIRILEGALTMVAAKSRLEKIPITLEMAEETLKNLISPEENEKKLTPEKIVTTVADHFNIPVEDIYSKKKSKDIAYPRQICMYLCRALTEYTFDEIGAAIGGRDHSTVIHAHAKIELAAENDENTRNAVEILKKKLQN